MRILYGISHLNSIDVTHVCFSIKRDNIITIPSCDHARARIFTDPFEGILKSVYIFNDDNLYEFSNLLEIKINLNNNTITTVNIKEIEEKINEIHCKTTLKYGSFLEELPEQKMSARCLSGNEKVLEIGSNIGRNSLVIASILKNSENFVTLECDKNTVERLRYNRDVNNFNFHIENSALSARKLIQHGWNTIPSDILLEGYNWVDTITFKDLQNKYKIDFDTLVLDCEGAFYYILMDMPEILNNIKLIIVENDYTDISHKNYVDNVLKSNNFYTYYVESGGWGVCYNNFYEIWKKL